MALGRSVTRHAKNGGLPHQRDLVGRRHESACTPPATRAAGHWMRRRRAPIRIGVTRRRSVLCLRSSSRRGAHRSCGSLQLSLPLAAAAGYCGGLASADPAPGVPHQRHHVTPVRRSLTAARLRPDTVEVVRDGVAVKK